MGTMRIFQASRVATWSAIGALAAVSLYGQQPATSDDPKVARGKYLVEEVAKCQDCHTPKMDNGDLIKSQWMKGASMGVVPVSPSANWRNKSPDATSTSTLWTRWTEEGMVKFFETGRNPRGSKAGAPMPTYTMKREDAEAVVAYLKTLP